MIRIAAILAFLCCNANAAQKLDINRLYTLPWIIGTAPQDFVWSAGGKSVAFLWNDEGTNFRDVWLATPGRPQPVRVTRMPRPKISVPVENRLPKMQEAADAEVDPGVTHVLWSPDQARLLFLFKGQLYAVRPGDQPELLTSKAPISAVKAAPSGNKIAFQSGPDLFIASMNSSGLATEVTRVGDAPLNAEDMVWSHAGRTLSFIALDESQIPLRAIPDYLGVETALHMVRRAFPGEPSERRRLGFVNVGEENRIYWANLGGDPFDLIFSIAWSPDDRTLLVDKSDLYIKDRRILLVHPQLGDASLLLRESDPKTLQRNGGPIGRPTEAASTSPLIAKTFTRFILRRLMALLFGA